MSLLSALAGAPAPPATERFGVFVDAFLDHFAQRHPSIAAGNGLHLYDDRLEDFSAAGPEPPAAGQNRFV